MNGDQDSRSLGDLDIKFECYIDIISFCSNSTTRSEKSWVACRAAI